MSEQDTQKFGDGSDNYADAAKHMKEAAKQIGQNSAVAAANAAAGSATVSAGAGGAAAKIAAAASGGPWGAAIAAAFAMRHTLFKLLICISLLLVFLITAIVSLPSVVVNNIFHTDPDALDLSLPAEMFAIYDDLSASIAGCVSDGYDHALDEVKRIVSEGGYDYDYSMESLINYANVSADYDACYIMAAYSASMGQRGAGKADMQGKLRGVIPYMFPVTYLPKETIKSVTAGNNGSEPATETIRYVECTIHPFDQSVILSAFNIDPAASYGQFQITYEHAIGTMASALKMTLYATLENGSVPPITDAELTDFLARLDCSPKRKELLSAALSLVGRVPYFWGGKSGPGWNDEWNTPKLVTSSGSSSTGTIRPYGLDCSGFTDWVYKTALGVSLREGSANQWTHSTAITKDKLLPGDLGFMGAPGSVSVNHVLIYVGKSESGEYLWVHCSSGKGVVLNSPSYVKYYRRANGIDLDGGALPPAANGPLYSFRMDPPERRAS